MKTSILALLAISAPLLLAQDLPAILIPAEPSPTLVLAAKEVRRYTYIRTGQLAEIRRTDTAIPTQPNVIALAPAGSRLLASIVPAGAFKDSLSRMKTDEHCLRAVRTESGRLLVIAGRDDIATLYGAYAYAELLGVRFHAHGDVVPDGLVPFTLPEVSEWHSPLFATRGLQPFHDFPEGPDWWTLEDYRAIFSQMVKMKMNFFGLHTYPEGGTGPEPTVWIGFAEDIRSGDSVAAAYPTRYFTTTGDPAWGYNPRTTGDYYYGFGELFPADSYGSEIMAGFTPHQRIGTYVPMPENELLAVEAEPIRSSDWSRLFTQSAAFYRKAFEHGRELGIKICVGTETPLVIPAAVKERAKVIGKDTADGRLRQALYEGMFRRINQTMPIDYYWFWTPEDWTWSGNNEEQVARTRVDLEAARRAAETTGSPFSLATCGWVLGPKQDRSMFDNFLPKTWAMSCINRDVGYEPVDPAFAKITGRPTWAIPWLEDDPALIVPQLWVGRARRDAADALAYGCTGLIGIHWRTRILSMNIASLARAGWHQHLWNPDRRVRLSPEAATHRSKRPERGMPTGDFYRDWAEAEFGRSAAEQIAAIFIRIDGLERYDRGRASIMNMPVPSDWVGGPGSIKPDSLTWEQRRNDYGFVDDFEKTRRLVTGAGAQERFDYWLNTFRYLRATGKFACSSGELNRLLATVRTDSLGDRSRYRQAFIDIRLRQMEELEELLTYLSRTISSRGELGTVANWQQHVMTWSVWMPGHEIERLTGAPLPENCWPSQKSLLEPGIIVPTVRTALRRGEGLRIEVILPGCEVQGARLHWKELAGKRLTKLDLARVNRSVWVATIPSTDLTDDIEYFIEVMTPDRTLRYPAGAPDRTQSVVVY